MIFFGINGLKNNASKTVAMNGNLRNIYEYVSRLGAYKDK